MADLENPFMGGGGYYDGSHNCNQLLLWKFDAHILKD